MFRIECYCDDKNLPRFLRAVTGIILETPKIMPVINAEVVTNGAGKAKVQQRSEGNAVDLLKQHLQDHHISSITMAQIRDFLESIGRSRKSGGTLTERALEAGVLRKAKGFRSGYVVVVK